MFAKKLLGMCAAGLAFGFSGCKEHVEVPQHPLQLMKSDASGNPVPGEVVATDTLAEGQIAFTHYCYGCHGPSGDGHGPAALGMRPPPRDFRMGLFKFAGTFAGSEPTDEALERTIRRGLQGTPMLPWDIPASERHSIVQYIKTFKCVPSGKKQEDVKSRFETDAPGAPLEISPDPWVGKEAQAVELGKKVYHVSGTDKDGKVYAGCSGCHAAYATREEISKLNQEVTGEPLTEFRDDLYGTATRESEYALALDENCEATKKFQVLPPDFLYNKTKSIWPLGADVKSDNDQVIKYDEKMQRQDIYRVVAAGVGGAAMPQWKGTLSEENLWALVYYVQHLVNLRGTPGALALREQLVHQPAFQPPAPPEPPPSEAKPEKKQGRPVAPRR